MYTSRGRKEDPLKFFNQARNGMLTKDTINVAFDADYIKRLTKEDIAIMLCFSLQCDADIDEAKDGLHSLVEDDFPGFPSSLAVSLCSRDYSPDPKRGYYAVPGTDSVLFIDKMPKQGNRLLVQHGWNSGIQMYLPLKVLSTEREFNPCARTFACFGHLPDQGGRKIQGPHYRYVDFHLLQDNAIRYGSSHRNI